METGTMKTGMVIVGYVSIVCPYCEQDKDINFFMASGPGKIIVCDNCHGSFDVPQYSDWSF